LFEDLPPVDEQATAAARQARAVAARAQPPRLLRPNRKQIALRASDLESLLGEDRCARPVWGDVERQDLSRLAEAIKARGSNATRAAIEPRILFAAAAVRHARRRGQRARDGAAGARARRAPLDLRRGAGERPRARRLSLVQRGADGRGAHGQRGGAGRSRGDQPAARGAGRGMRVRAGAGAASFRRQASLQQHLAGAAEWVREIKPRA
jgi:hypothetical protein